MPTQYKMKFVQDGAGGTQITEIRRDMGMCATSVYWKVILEIRIAVRSAIRNAQICKSKTKAERTILQDYTRFPGTVLQQWTASRFVLRWNKGAYRQRKSYSELNGGCRNKVGAQDV